MNGWRGIEEREKKQKLGKGKKGRDGGGGESRGCISCTVEGWKGVKGGQSVCIFTMQN